MVRASESDLTMMIGINEGSVGASVARWSAVDIMTTGAHGAMADMANAVGQ